MLTMLFSLVLIAPLLIIPNRRLHCLETLHSLQRTVVLLGHSNNNSSHFRLALLLQPTTILLGTTHNSNHHLCLALLLQPTAILSVPIHSKNSHFRLDLLLQPTTLLLVTTHNSHNHHLCLDLLLLQPTIIPLGPTPQMLSHQLHSLEAPILIHSSRLPLALLPTILLLGQQQIHNNQLHFLEEVLHLLDLATHKNHQDPQLLLLDQTPLEPIINNNNNNKDY
ncbi:hypothetical protein BC941DRAFT_432616 [Chlamydoabsidia padenii]|nr:hypothetical protein BC941DRAFT_432616 [Chlamydoabsidia padenii]